MPEPIVPDLRTAAQALAEVFGRDKLCPVCDAWAASEDHADGCEWGALRAALAAEATEPPPLKPRGFGPNFAWAAAPQAIEHHVDAYRQKLTRLARELRWLENLLAERNAQVARGEWPPAKEATP